jgi:hypothetical protein
MSNAIEVIRRHVFDATGFWIPDDTALLILKSAQEADDPARIASIRDENSSLRTEIEELERELGRSV